MNGKRPLDTLEEELGEGMFPLAPPPPCKKLLGYRTIHVKGSSKVKAHTRQWPVTEPYKRCRCNLHEGAVAAKAPDLNICENAFNYIQTELSREGMTIGWPKNVDELEARISKIIRSIPKNWFRKAFSSLPNRWRKCVNLKGKMTDYYTPKNT